MWASRALAPTVVILWGLRPSKPKAEVSFHLALRRKSNFLDAGGYPELRLRRRATVEEAALSEGTC
jgi:hypothetical protein